MESFLISLSLFLAAASTALIAYHRIVAQRFGQAVAAAVDKFDISTNWFGTPQFTPCPNRFIREGKPENRFVVSDEVAGINPAVRDSTPVKIIGPEHGLHAPGGSDFAEKRRFYGFGQPLKK